MRVDELTDEQLTNVVIRIMRAQIEDLTRIDVYEMLAWLCDVDEAGDDEVTGVRDLVAYYWTQCEEMLRG